MEVSFPKLGLEFDINRVAFSLFGMDIYWYALLIMTGCILIDSIFRPLWKGIDRFGGMIQARIGF